MPALLRTAFLAASAVAVAAENCSSILPSSQTCHLLSCDGPANAQCQSGKCVCGPGTCAVNGRCEADGKTSIGDRLVLELKWIGNASTGGKYINLPLTAADATAQGWSVSEKCEDGRGREATNEGFANGALHLWYDSAGVVIGYEAIVTHGLNDHICKKTSTGSRCAVMFRKEASACSSEASSIAAEGVTSIGDRLVIPYWGGELPLTSDAAKKHSPPFIDTGNCLPNMGHHFVTPLTAVQPIMTMYTEGSGTLTGILISDPIGTEPSPPWEKFAEFHNAMSLHLYVAEHMGACKTSLGDVPSPPVHV